MLISCITMFEFPTCLITFAQKEQHGPWWIF